MAILATGAIVKDIVAVLFAFAIIYFAVVKNLFRALEIYFIWFFIYNYFTGQGFIQNEIISKFLTKPSFLITIVFFFYMNKIPGKLFSRNFIMIWLIFLILTILSSLVHNQSPFVIFTLSAFFITFLILQARGLTFAHHKRLLNLFVAVALVQTMISFMQVTQFIAPPSKMMDDGSGNQFEWVAGLDDVASGTFGPVASHLAGWYAALISVILVLVWSVEKKGKYILIACCSFLQFATADSKIIMGVTILMIVTLLFYLFRNRTLFKIKSRRYITLLAIVFVGSLSFYIAWDTYYEYYGEKTGGSRVSLKSVYKNEAQFSSDLILENLTDWGKIRGFQYVFKDFIDSDISLLFWGYGVNGYNFNGKMGYIEQKGPPIMQLNNFTNSRSGLIKQFAVSGLLGILLFLISIFLWARFNNQKVRNKYDLIKNSLLKIYLPFTFIAAFLYSIELSSIPVIAFSAIISIYLKMSEFDRQEQIMFKNNAIQKSLSHG